MSTAEIGVVVWLKPSQKRYHPGLARIVGRDRHYYVVHRIGDFPGTGQRRFRVHRYEFDIIEPGESVSTKHMAEAVRRLA